MLDRKRRESQQQPNRASYQFRWLVSIHFLRYILNTRQVVRADSATFLLERRFFDLELNSEVTLLRHLCQSNNDFHAKEGELLDRARGRREVMLKRPPPPVAPYRNSPANERAAV